MSDPRQSVGLGTEKHLRRFLFPGLGKNLQRPKAAGSKRGSPSARSWEGKQSSRGDKGFKLGPIFGAKPGLKVLPGKGDSSGIHSGEPTHKGETKRKRREKPRRREHTIERHEEAKQHTERAAADRNRSNERKPNTNNEKKEEANDHKSSD